MLLGPLRRRLLVRGVLLGRPALFQLPREADLMIQPSDRIFHRLELARDVLPRFDERLTLGGVLELREVPM